jgi:hypothetical protein
LRLLLSREHFANRLRIYSIDQDEQQEDAGRFVDYLGGRREPIRSIEDAEAFHFVGVDLGLSQNDDVVIWDLHQYHEADRGRIFAFSRPSSSKICSSTQAVRRLSSTRRSR